MSRRLRLSAFLVLTVLLTLAGQSCASAPVPTAGITPAATAASAPTAATALAATGVAATPTVVAAPSATKPPDATATPTAVPSTATPQPTATPARVDTSVKPKTDPTSAKTTLIAAKAGGKIELKAASGVIYTLEIPKGALLGDELITMASVSQIDGLPLSGGLLGAVELKPEGLRLMKAATLTIQVPAGFKAADLIGFSYKATGAGFHLYPVSAEGSTVTASLSHFSGVGGGQGTSSDSDAQQARTPTDAESALEQDLAAGRERARRTNFDDKSTQMFEDALRRFFNNQIAGHLKSAETNDAVLDSTIGEYLAWKHKVELVGLSDKFISEADRAEASLKKGLKNAFDKASERCAKDVDWEQGLKMIRWATTDQWLFGGTVIDMSTLTTKLQACWTFRLDYESIVTWQLETNMDIVAHVKSQVTLKMRSDLSALDGSGKLEYVKYEAKWKGESSQMNELCQVTLGKTNTTLNVSPAVFGINPRAAGSGPPFVVLEPGNTTETMSLRCKVGPGSSIWTNQPFPSLGWRMGFGEANKSREYYESTVNGVNMGNPKYIFNNFQNVGKTVVARETGTSTADVKGSKVTDEYTIDIVHTPKS